MEYDQNGYVGAVYTQTPDQYGALISVSGNKSPAFYFYDALGSVTEATDDTENLVIQYRYDAFGCRIIDNGDDKIDGFAFVGKQGYYSNLDGKLIYLRARWYDPTIGQFISQDPVTDGDNWYAYVGDNPVNRTDPSGLKKYLCTKTCLPGGARGYFLHTCCDWDKNYGSWYVAFPLNSRGKMQECKDPELFCDDTSPTTRRCGPDISDKLKDVLDRVKQDFDRLSFQTKCSACNKGLLGNLVSGWDITQLNDQNWIELANSKLQCPVSEGCKRTVGIGGKCYDEGVVNYVLFGKAFGLCSKSMKDGDWSADRMTTLIRRWKSYIKFVYPDTTTDALVNAAVEFAKVGYYNRSIDSVPALVPNRQCAKCSKCWDRTFGYHWDYVRN